MRVQVLKSVGVFLTKRGQGEGLENLFTKTVEEAVRTEQSARYESGPIVVQFGYKNKTLN